MEWKMQNKKIKFTKTNLEKLPHPAHDQRERKYFASNCSHPAYQRCGLRRLYRKS